MSDQQYEQDPSGADDAYTAGYSAGSLLRAAREARGESIADVAHALKLAQRQVEAMELDRFDLLPGPAFVRGFLRNYARYLGVDAEAMLAALSNDLTPQKVDLAPVTNATGAMPDGNGEQRVLKPAVIIILGLLLALGTGWYFDWFKLADTPPVVSRSEIGPLHDLPMPPELLTDKPGAQEPAREDVRANVDAQAQGAPLDAEPAREAAVPPAAVEATAPAAAPSTEAKPAAVAPLAGAGTVAKPEPEPEPEPDQAASPVAPEATPSAVPVEESALPAGLSRLVFTLDGESWIQVRDTDDVTLFSGVAAAGTTRTVQGKPPFSLVIGNAAKVALEHDGKPVDLAPHTRSGGVARMKLEQAGQ